jgi:hypothetical protein
VSSNETIKDLEKENQELKTLVDKLEQEKKDLEDNPKTVTVQPSDPFPTYPDCPDDTGTWASYSAKMDCERQYLREKEAWYATHGQSGQIYLKK